MVRRTTYPHGARLDRSSVNGAPVNGVWVPVVMPTVSGVGGIDPPGPPSTEIDQASKCRSRATNRPPSGPRGSRQAPAVNSSRSPAFTVSVASATPLTVLSNCTRAVSTTFPGVSSSRVKSHRSSPPGADTPSTPVVLTTHDGHGTQPLTGSGVTIPCAPLPSTTENGVVSRMLPPLSTLVARMRY